MRHTNVSSANKTIGNGLKLISANAIAQAIAVASHFIIIRLYSPEAIGSLSIMLAIVGIGTILASFRYEQAIIVERDLSRAAALFDVALCTNILICTIVASVICLQHHSIANLLNNESLSAFICYIPPLIFLSSLGYVTGYWFNRHNHFGLSARYTLVQSVAGNGLKILLGAAGFVGSGLFNATLGGQAIGLLSVIRRQRWAESPFKFNFKLMRQVAHQYIDFPKFNLPHAFVNTLASNVPVMILAWAFPLDAVGIFALAITIGLKPVNIFAGSMNQVLFHSVSQNNINNRLSMPMLKRFCLRTAAATLVISIAIYAILPYISATIFGPEWNSTGRTIQYMLPWFSMSIIAMPLNFLPLIAGLQKQALCIECVYTITRMIPLLIGIALESIELSILTFSIFNALFLGAQLVWFLYIAKQNDLQISAKANITSEP